MYIYIYTHIYTHMSDVWIHWCDSTTAAPNQFKAVIGLWWDGQGAGKAAARCGWRLNFGPNSIELSKQVLEMTFESDGPWAMDEIEFSGDH